MKNPFLNIYIVFLFVLCTNSYAGVNYKNQLSFSMGMINNSFTQQESAFSADKEITSGAGSVIALDLSYEVFSLRKRSYFFRFAGSGIAGEVSKYYSLGAGQKFYFSADGTSSTFEDESIKITTSPVLRYYAGWNVGLFSSIYEPLEEVRGDIGVEFGGHGGLLYSVDKRTSYKAEFVLQRGTGVETTSMNMQILFGTSYFVDSLF